jgi:hypothetical protein
LTRLVPQFAAVDTPAGNAPVAVVDGSTENRQLSGMKSRILIVALVALLVGISAGWAGRGFIASDRCLDRGGAWDAALDACERPIANGS